MMMTWALSFVTYRLRVVLLRRQEQFAMYALARRLLVPISPPSPLPDLCCELVTNDYAHPSFSRLAGRLIAPIIRRAPNRPARFAHFEACAVHQK
jgi:hypothetical protein